MVYVKDINRNIPHLVILSPRGLGESRTPWSAEKMLDGQRQRVGVPAHARSAHDGLPQKNKTKQKTNKQTN